MDLFLGIDLGTSYFKAGLFDVNGKLRGLGRHPVKKITFDGITCELRIDVFWDTLRKCNKDALEQAGATSDSIKSISYSSQANSFILLDDKNKPLTPLILWPDNRAEGIDFWENLTYENFNFQGTAGLGISLNHQFAIAKLNWFRKKKPQLWDRVKHIMSISDYFVFCLTGQKICDYSTASMSGLLDIQKKEWWDDLLQTINIKKDQLPIPQQIGTYIDSISDEGEYLIGLKQAIPFYLGGLDHHVAAIGAGIPYNKNISESSGTVLASVNYQDKFLPKNKICIAPGLDDKHFFQMAFDDNGASSLEWYRNNFASTLSILELLETASQVEIGSEGLIAMPCVHKFPGLSGFKNIKPLHNHGHFTRAILESTAFSLTKLLAALPGTKEANGIVPTGGGAQSKLWIAIKANMVGKSFFIPECNETACMGAAMIGALGIKIFNNLDEAINRWGNFYNIIEPELMSIQRYNQWQETNK